MFKPSRRPPSPEITRRLLLQAPVAGVAAAGAAAAAPAEAEPRVEEDPRRPRYAVTEHVRTYYARARG